MSGRGSRHANHPPGSCVLTAINWEGDLPVPGQYLRARHGRTAYLIVGVTPGPRHAKYRAKLACERRPFDEPGPADKVYGWEWSAR